MGKKFYHNITKKIYNETDVVELIENMDEGDLILYSISGNALVNEISHIDLNKLKKIVADFYEDNEEI